MLAVDGCRCRGSGAGQVNDPIAGRGRGEIEHEEVVAPAELRQAIWSSAGAVAGGSISPCRTPASFVMVASCLVISAATAGGVTSYLNVGETCTGK